MQELFLFLTVLYLLLTTNAAAGRATSSPIGVIPLARSVREQRDVKSKEPRRLTSRQLQMVNFFSGGFAGTLSSTLTLPLEVLKTQLQSSRLGRTTQNPIEMCKIILEKEGPSGFFKGLKPMLIGIIPTRAIYFWAYTETKTALRPRLGDSPLNHLLAAFSAGITSNTIMNPWWMVKTRFQIIADKSVGQVQFKNYGDLIKLIYKEEGVAGFYKGVVASYVGCIEGAIQWMVYEQLKTALQRKADKQGGNAHKGVKPGGNMILTEKKGEIKPSEYFLAAAFSKAIAILASYPHEVVRTRMREQATNGVFKYQGFLNTLTTISKEEGLRGMYSGMGIHLARSVPNAALMFLTFELISKALSKSVEVQPFISLPKTKSRAL